MTFFVLLATSARAFFVSADLAILSRYGGSVLAVFASTRWGVFIDPCWSWHLLGTYHSDSTRAIYYLLVSSAMRDSRSLKCD